MGEALGGTYEHSPHKEIGVFDLHLTSAGKNDFCFAQFPHQFASAHWHGDMPGLTPDAEILAYSEGCPRQIIRYTPNVYGFQCHLEFTPQCVQEMVQNAEEELQACKHLPYVQTPQHMLAQAYQ